MAEGFDNYLTKLIDSEIMTIFSCFMI